MQAGRYSHHTQQRIGIQTTKETNKEKTNHSTEKREIYSYEWNQGGFPGGSVGKNLPASAGDTVQSLIWEDPTRSGATKPVCQDY